MDIVAALDSIRTTSLLTEPEERRKELTVYLNHLILNDFAALVQLLYRVDVPEEKLKAVLKENPQANAGDLLADLLIQRQKEKVTTRQPSFPTDKPSAEEAW